MPEKDMGYMMEMEVDKAEDMAKMPIQATRLNQKLAHAYVPWQHYNKAFTPQEALAKGTLFPELWGVYPIPK